MVVYTINSQVDAYFELRDIMHKVSEEFLYSILDKWGIYIDGVLYVDYTMFVYEVKTQLKNNDY